MFLPHPILSLGNTGDSRFLSRISLPWPLLLRQIFQQSGTSKAVYWQTKNSSCYITIVNYLVAFFTGIKVSSIMEIAKTSSESKLISIYNFRITDSYYVQCFLCLLLYFMNLSQTVHLLNPILQFPAVGRTKSSCWRRHKRRHQPLLTAYMQNWETNKEAMVLIQSIDRNNITSRARKKNLNDWELFFNNGSSLCWGKI